MASNLYEIWWKRKGERSANTYTQLRANSVEEARRKFQSSHRDKEIVDIKKL